LKKKNLAHKTKKRDTHKQQISTHKRREFRRHFGSLLKIDFDFCARATNDVEERDDDDEDDEDGGVSECVRSKTNDRSRPISKKREKQKEDDDDEKRTEEFAARQRGRRRKERKTFKSKQQMQ
jgi:hypothetical protein